MRSRAAAIAFGLLLVVAPAARAGDDAAKTEARAFFESGVAHFDRSEWSAALADFLRSRAVFPTRSATKNAAVCLRREGRFDEALEMYEALLREFKDLSPADRTFAQTEIEALRGSVGAIDIAGSEPGASIVIDGRERGEYPPPASLRVAAGSHVVRLYKEGFSPFERRIDVAGRQSVVVDARLQALTRAGRLAVTETSGQPLDVVVDNVVVGKTPWEGTVAAGVHTVLLRGANELGTQPATADVKLGEKTNLSLAAEALGSSLRLVPVPAGATVSIDSVVVGQGVWEGKLRAGAHRLEVAAEGFLPSRTSATLAKGERSQLTVTLERDQSSPLWKRTHPARVFFGGELGLALGAVYGGDVRDACQGSCSPGLPVGLSVTARGGYEFSSGIMLGVDVGYVALAGLVEKRPAQLLPFGLAANQGTADDDLGLRGFRFGPHAGYRLPIGERLYTTLRLGAGLFLGSAVDVRKGRFTTSGGTAYDTDLSESVPTQYVYVAPEARFGGVLAGHFDVGLGVSAYMLFSLNQPQWRNEHTALAGLPTATTAAQSDGFANFPRETTAGSFVLAIVPGLDVRYAF
ncbi:MAG: PEGA domain-containing protein [Labilithrix sp.]